MTPQIPKKDALILPNANNKNLPPKPIQNNNYKMPPKPSNNIPSSKQNNSVDYSRN
jgi:hypothetical protein